MSSSLAEAGSRWYNSLYADEATPLDAAVVARIIEVINRVEITV